jgi:hypothetical protein
MTPQGNEHLPSLDLPKLQTEQPNQVTEALPSAISSERVSSIAVEQGVQPQASPSQTPIIPPAQTAAITQTPVQQPISPSANPSLAGTPVIADDADLIEKEWVEKAKEIVEQTKLDPFAQNKELNKMKADYMKKRYNKDIKLQDQ